MSREVYDSIRRIDEKEEKIKKIIQSNELLSALEQYQLIEDFEDEDILRILRALQPSIGSFAAQALLGLLKLEDNLIEGFLLVRDKMELNDLVSLINRVHRPLTKLRMIEMCKNQFNTQSFIRLLNASKNIEMAKKIVDILNHLSTENEDVLKQIEDSEIREYIVDAFSKRREKDSSGENESVLLEFSEKFIFEEEKIEKDHISKIEPSVIYKEMIKLAGIVPGYLQEEAFDEILSITTEREVGKKVMEH